MEPEGSLPHSQVPANCPYPEPVRFSPSPPTCHFLKIHLNIMPPSTPRSPKWSLSLRFPHQNPICTSLLPHTRYMPRPSHFPFDHPNNIEWAVKILHTWICREKPVSASLPDISVAHLTYSTGLFQYSLGVLYCTRPHNSLSRTLTFLPSYNPLQFTLSFILK